MFKARITYSLFYFTIKRTLGFFVRGPRPNALRDYTFLLYRYLSFLHCRLSFLQSTLSFFTFEQFIFPAIYIRVLYLFFNISALYLLHFIFLHSHHLPHHNIHLVTQHQDRLVSRSVLKSLHPRQREPCGRDRSFLGP